jgi:SWI/SNF-related matrix-associated actin-dependent regulator of chromatin subfamily A member 5
MLDCCEDFLSLKGGDGEIFRFSRLDGGTSRARRNLAIRLFNNEDSEIKIMLISTRAGGLGVNLAAASDVVMLDQDWNPQVMLQAEARAHRIGQTKPVTVYKLCTQGTVEEQMIGRIQKKLFLSAKVTESMRDIHASGGMKAKRGRPSADATDDDMPQLNQGQLISIIRRGAQTLSRPEVDVTEMLSWDWPTILEKCKDKPADSRNSEQAKGDPEANEEEEKKWLTETERVESYVFNGKKYTKGRLDTGDGIKQEWDRRERRKGKNMTVMVGGYAVSKESMSCKDWEAVPTLAGRDPRFADVRREKKAAIENQNVSSSSGGPLLILPILTNSISSTVKCAWMVARSSVAVDALVRTTTNV